MMGKVSLLGWVSIFVTIACTVVGQLLIKRGMLDVGASPLSLAALPRFVWRAGTNPFVIAGFLAALLGALAWTVAISRADLSVAYPFVGLGIVLVLVLSGLIFGESVPANRWIGVLFVCIGIAIAAR
jgi:multidrug transporter EmrE-like cation transporter